MIWTILLFLGVLSVLVLVHEWGHYYTAKKIGAKVEEFGLGFPPRAFSWKGKDGMTWSLNWIPLGGFVKIKGESGQDRTDEDSFAHKSIPARLLVLCAGVGMNMILAIILLSIGFLIGVPTVTETIVDDHAVIFDEAITVTDVLVDSPASQAGLEPGDQLVSINGISYNDGAMARDALVSEDGSPVEVEIQRGEERLTYQLSTMYYEELDRQIVGVGLLETGRVKYPWYLAPVKGVEATVAYTWQILVGFGTIIGSAFHQDSAPVDVAGPIGIAVMTGEVVALGFVYLLQFAAILSINLAILNILPIPALDGGRVLFVLIEAVRRKPNNQTVEAVVHNIGFALLMVLVIIVTYKDIAGLF